MRITATPSQNSPSYSKGVVTLPDPATHPVSPILANTVITAHYRHRRITTQHVIILAFSKAFDTVAYNKLISKLQNYGIQRKNNKWVNK